MIIENAFEVPGGKREAMAMLLDAGRVVPCMPGAELVEVVDERNWRTRMRVKLGPVGMDFDNRITLVASDEEAGTVAMQLSGRDSRGKGGAEGTVDATFTEHGHATTVAMVTDLRLSGQAAQLGRPNVVKDVASAMVAQFAENLRQEMRSTAVPAGDEVGGVAAGDGASTGVTAAPRAAARPISGFSILMAAVRGALSRLFRRSGG